MPELGKTPDPDRKVPQKKRVSTALLRIAERSLQVDPRHIDAYRPTEFDLQIAEAHLSGCVTFADMAEQIGCSSQCVGNRMKDPLVCAWISRQVHSAIHHRLGLIDAAMMNRAMSGDVRAADLMYKRYGQMETRHVNVNVGMDFKQLEDRDLDAFIKDAQKNVVVEVTPGSSETGVGQLPVPSPDPSGEDVPPSDEEDL